MVLMTLCGILGVFYVFSMQEKQAFLEYKEHVQQLKSQEITEMLGKIDRYRGIHNASNLQRVFPTILQRHSLEYKERWNCKNRLFRVRITTKITNTCPPRFCLATRKSIGHSHSFPTTTKLGVRIYKVHILSSEEMAARIVNQTEDNDDSELPKKKKKQNIQKQRYKNNEKRTQGYIQVDFEYPLPKWENPPIFSNESFVRKGYDVLAFLAYWEMYQNIQYDRKLIISINDHIHQKITEQTENIYERYVDIEKSINRTMKNKHSHIQCFICSMSYITVTYKM